MICVPSASISSTTSQLTTTARLSLITAGQSSLAVASTSSSHIPSSPWAAPPKKTAAAVLSPSHIQTNSQTKQSMYKIAEERFQELYRQYACKLDNTQDYSHYLQTVQEDGQNLFDVPEIYLTNEVIMTALETPNNPIELLPRMTLEYCVSKKLKELAPLFREPITEKDREVYFKDLRYIIEFRYNKSLYPNHNFSKKKLYTFIDFFEIVTQYYSGYFVVFPSQYE